MDSQEIMHDTLLKYHSYIFKSRIDNLDKWLTSICIRKSIDKIRAQKRLDFNLQELKNDIVNDNDTFCSIEPSMFADKQETDIIEIIKNSISKLPDKYRILLSLVLIEGFDYKEVEQITSIKEGTARTIYSRGIKQLHKIINNHE